MKSSLTAQQKKTLTYIIGTVLALALAGGLVYDANRRRVEAASLKQDVERKEREAASLRIPSEAEQEQWAKKEKEFSSLLLPDQEVPQFLEEVTRLANENRLQRLGISNEDKVLDPQQAGNPEDAKLLALGIHRFIQINLKFQSEYPDAARFLAAVAQLPRPVEFQVVDMRRTVPLVDVLLTLKVYKREPA